MDWSAVVVGCILGLSVRHVYYRFRKPKVKKTRPPLQYELPFGSACHTTTGYPARYIGEGKAAYIIDDAIAYADAAEPDGSEYSSPLPSDHEILVVKSIMKGGELYELNDE